MEAKKLMLQTWRLGKLGKGQPKIRAGIA